MYTAAAAAAATSIDFVRLCRIQVFPRCCRRSKAPRPYTIRWPLAHAVFSSFVRGDRAFAIPPQIPTSASSKITIADICSWLGLGLGLAFRVRVISGNSSHDQIVTQYGELTLAALSRSHVAIRVR